LIQCQAWALPDRRHKRPAYSQQVHKCLHRARFTDGKRVYCLIHAKRQGSHELRPGMQLLAGEKESLKCHGQPRMPRRKRPS